ncbi:hypothetical protein D3C75_987780 [compost metagenome]
MQLVPDLQGQLLHRRIVAENIILGDAEPFGNAGYRVAFLYRIEQRLFLAFGKCLNCFFDSQHFVRVGLNRNDCHILLN